MAQAMDSTQQTRQSPHRQVTQALQCNATTRSKVMLPLATSAFLFKCAWVVEICTATPSGSCMSLSSNPTCGMQQYVHERDIVWRSPNSLLSLNPTITFRLCARMQHVWLPPLLLLSSFAFNIELLTDSVSCIILLSPFLLLSSNRAFRITGCLRLCSSETSTRQCGALLFDRVECQETCRGGSAPNGRWHPRQLCEQWLLHSQHPRPKQLPVLHIS